MRTKCCGRLNRNVQVKVGDIPNLKNDMENSSKMF